jgi:hypothetical protein
MARRVILFGRLALSLPLPRTKEGFSLKNFKYTEKGYCGFSEVISASIQTLKFPLSIWWNLAKLLATLML